MKLTDLPAGSRIRAKIVRWSVAREWPADTSDVVLELDDDGFWNADEGDPAAPFTVVPACRSSITVLEFLRFGSGEGATPAQPMLAEILAVIDGERGYMDNWAGRARNDALTDAREAVEKLFQDRPATPAIDREALAAAAHQYYCVLPDEPTHDPDEIDYDKADEILEILALIGGAS